MNTVEPTEQDFALALRTMWMQAKSRGVEFTWEFRDYLLFEAENKSIHFAWMRFYQNIINRSN